MNNNMPKSSMELKELMGAAEHVKSFPVGAESEMSLCLLWESFMVSANRINEKYIPHINMPKLHICTFNYCISGRCEVKLPDGNYIYMEPGVMCINENMPKEGYAYPGGSYTGIEIGLDMQSFSKACPHVLCEVGIDAEGLKKILGKNNGTCICRLSDNVRELVRQLYTGLKELKYDPYKYKYILLNIFYELWNERKTGTGMKKYVTKGQREIADDFEKKISLDLSKHFRIEDMAVDYGVSPSALKSYFESVFGKPVSSYLKEKRMNRACELLTGSRRSIGEIAGLCGYANQGKFGEAFKIYSGVSPLEYRRRNFK